ncbi:hypothetical protein DL98DRAFT_540116 [Cadophora sp. DSE1049]|nr:hypothetical protein DL98DRAFT_540116 [Cadophora sp. DSE1049]
MHYKTLGKPRFHFSCPSFLFAASIDVTQDSRTYIQRLGPQLPSSTNLPRSILHSFGAAESSTYSDGFGRPGKFSQVPPVKRRNTCFPSSNSRQVQYVISQSHLPSEVESRTRGVPDLSSDLQSSTSAPKSRTVGNHCDPERENDFTLPPNSLPPPPPSPLSNTFFPDSPANASPSRLESQASLDQDSVTPQEASSARQVSSSLSPAVPSQSYPRPPAAETSPPNLPAAPLLRPQATVLPTEKKCCPRCPRKFESHRELQVHHDSNEHKHPCTHAGCRWTFGLEKDLTRHFEQKHGGPLYKYNCTLCPHGCSRLDNFRRHYRTVHRMEQPPSSTVLSKSLF